VALSLLTDRLLRHLYALRYPCAAPHFVPAFNLGPILGVISDRGLCFCRWFELAVFLVGLAGFGLTAMGVGWQTALQLTVDNTLRGRVMSFWGATSFGGVALGAPFWAPSRNEVTSA
tara:strand:- start:768 stop:1118 length:351 start_codon:yes stop_codon:yes gene_type:complete